MSGAKMNLDDILDQALEDFEKEFKKRNPVAEKKTTPSSSTMKTDIEPQIKQQTASLTSSQSQTSYKTTQNLLPENDCMNMKPSSSAATNKMMDDLLNQFDESENDKKGDEDDDDDEVIDGMMQQLLSKDLMCEPTRLLCERYPTWLSENKDKITEEQYLNYEKQYITFQRLLATYDTQPDNYTRIMELMYDIQKFDQPPAEIIKDLAPGLQFDSNGIPVSPLWGDGGEPDMSAFGEGGMPPDLDKCVIM